MRQNPFDKYLSREDILTAHVIQYLKDYHSDKVFFHCPSESKKSAFERYKFVKLGAIAGVPDLCILYPKYNDGTLQYHGLCVELKVEEHTRIVKKGKKAGQLVKAVGKLSQAQMEILEKLNKASYRAVCCYGYDETIKEIEDYLGKPPRFGVNNTNYYHKSVLTPAEYKSFIGQKG